MTLLIFCGIPNSGQQQLIASIFQWKYRPVWDDGSPEDYLYTIDEYLKFGVDVIAAGTNLESSVRRSLRDIADRYSASTGLVLFKNVHQASNLTEIDAFRDAQYDLSKEVYDVEVHINHVLEGEKK